TVEHFFYYHMTSQCGMWRVELICPICKELFTHPLILPCQHSVCHKCVRELLMLNHDDSFDAGSECSLPGSPRSRHANSAPGLLPGSHDKRHCHFTLRVLLQYSLSVLPQDAFPLLHEHLSL
uniref:RING-type domain-containing protein n=1 Tax=Periophthalmus magnuspinnatus TaxID=409849 RepID=A0A3B4AWZ4_9GOBI